MNTFPTVLKTAILLYATLFSFLVVAQQSDNSKSLVLFTNVNVFDGQNEKRIENANVLVEGNQIKMISTSPIQADGAEIIDGKGKTLMPGLTDAHWHTMFNSPPASVALSADMGYINLAAAKSAEQTLLRGFTTVRDAGGNPFSVKRAIDEGMYSGPRIYASGPMISQTSGHADYRTPNEPDHPNYLEGAHMAVVADGVPAVMTAVRQALRLGATQIKIAAGGGVSSNYDPLDVTEYTFEELKAAVDVAKTWNTYVMVHVNTDAAIRQAIEAGVMSIDHGFLMEEDTVKLMAKKGVWFSMQPLLDDEDAIQFPPGSVNQRKWIQVTNGTDKVIKLAKKYKVKTAFGTDVLFDPELGKKQGKLLAKLKRWYSPYEILKMATYDNAQLIKLCGPRDPYPGEIGVVKEGALADLILVDGNPLVDIDLVANPDEKFVIIMKDGKIYKNTL